MLPGGGLRKVTFRSATCDLLLEQRVCERGNNRQGLTLRFGWPLSSTSPSPAQSIPREQTCRQGSCGPRAPSVTGTCLQLCVRFPGQVPTAVRSMESKDRHMRRVRNRPVLQDCAFSERPGPCCLSGTGASPLRLASRLASLPAPPPGQASLPTWVTLRAGSHPPGHAPNAIMSPLRSEGLLGSHHSPQGKYGGPAASAMSPCLRAPYIYTPATPGVPGPAN